ncbi:ABC transporter permease [Iamia sp. SCSIO 61187]|uniref:ABC transporter permease n=1 Tax=Iamia sp. SCSIO 61187 TaxID=2722752 RepID=UPI001C635386|nr:ABC transporter permease [Iamia sp. SCSIO 61187]
MSGFESWLEFMADDWSAIWALTVEHATMVIQVMVAATVFSVALGIAVDTRRLAFAREPALIVASVLLTVPSLALFTLFIPIFGIGYWPPRVALFLYAILPILRNTVTGLDSVDQAVEESARGMGMSWGRRLLQIRLPLAWPVIVTGVRVSTLLVTGIAAIATLVNGGGLGDLIKEGFNRLGLPGSMEAIWAGTVMVVAVALVLDLALALLVRIFSPRFIAAASEVPTRLLERRRTRATPQEALDA